MVRSSRISSNNQVSIITSTHTLRSSCIPFSFPGFPVRFSSCLQVLPCSSCNFRLQHAAKICQAQISKKISDGAKKQAKSRLPGRKKIFFRGGFKTGSGPDPKKKRPETAATPRTQAHTPTHTPAYAHAHGRLRLHTPARIHTHMPAHTGVPAHACPHTPAPERMGAHLYAHAYAHMGAHTRTRMQERNAGGTDHAKTQERTRTDGNRPGEQVSRAEPEQIGGSLTRSGTDTATDQRGDIGKARSRPPTRTDERTPTHTHTPARTLDSRNAGSP